MLFISSAHLLAPAIPTTRFAPRALATCATLTTDTASRTRDENRVVWFELPDLAKADDAVKPRGPGYWPMRAGRSSCLRINGAGLLVID